MMNLSQYLDAEKVTQAKFAELVGVNQSTVSKLCQGRYPSLELAIKISRATDNAVPVAAWPNLGAVIDAAKAAEEDAA